MVDPSLPNFLQCSCMPAVLGGLDTRSEVRKALWALVVHGSEGCAGVQGI